MNLCLTENDHLCIHVIFLSCICSSHLHVHVVNADWDFLKIFVLSILSLSCSFLLLSLFSLLPFEEYSVYAFYQFLPPLSFSTPSCYTQSYEVFWVTSYHYTKLQEYRYVTWLVICTRVFLCVLGYLHTQHVYVHIANIVSMGNTQYHRSGNFNCKNILQFV